MFKHSFILFFFSVYLYTCFLYVIAHSMFDNFLFVHLCLFDARSCFLILRLKKKPVDLKQRQFVQKLSQPCGCGRKKNVKAV